MLPDDLTERIRACAERSLLPGAAMPGDEEGLYGRIDPAAMDRQLAALRRELGRYVPRVRTSQFWKVPSWRMFSLQLLAPFWRAAERARQRHAQDFDNPTIDSIEASIRRRTFILSHVPGHEAQFRPWSRRAAGMLLAAYAAGPILFFAVLEAMAYSGCEPALRACRASLTERLVALDPQALLSSAQVLVFPVLAFVPGVMAVLIDRLRHGDPVSPTRV